MRVETNPLPTTAPSPSGLGSNPGLSSSRDQFLRLFVAQLQNQNPLDPQSGADMVAQLAQFTSVEQQVETNKRLTDLASAQDAAGAAGLANLVGRTVGGDCSTFELDGQGPPPPIELSADTAITGGEVVIRNSGGREIARRPIVAGPPASVAWDGRDRDGAPVPAGAYALEITATSRDGALVTARPRMTATVDAIELGAAGPRLHLGHARLSPAAVTTIANQGSTR